MIKTCEPFLRWAGGKRWLAGRLAHVFHARKHSRLIEPFLGSGATFFRTAPQVATLNDLNAELIETYDAVRLHAPAIERALADLPVDADTYYAMRSSQPGKKLDRAVRFIYLNRSCYGGLYRTNKQGKYNVPFGGGSRTPKIVWERKLLRSARALLRKESVVLQTGDFESVIDQSEQGDFVYCDPTYRPVSRDSFDRYGPNVFSWEDQLRLAAAGRRALARGATVVISNGYHPDIRDLYTDAITVALKRGKAIGNRSKNGKSALELLAIFDPRSCSSDWAPFVETSVKSDQVPALRPEPDADHLLVDPSML